LRLRVAVVTLAVAAALLPATARPTAASASPSATLASGGPGDATVVAVLDTGLVPYHWDFLASKMPQAQNSNPSDDLPLHRPAHEWLPGFPNPAREFKSFDRLDLTLDAKNEMTPIASLDEADKKVWESVKQSTPDKLRAYWMPGTKVIGALTLHPSTKIHSKPDAHGVGTTSSSVGNLHGTCPECLLFYIETGPDRVQNEAAINWAMSQPWIDAISNSYGYSLLVRDRVYSGSDVRAQRDASERGQTVFFSAGNGQANAFLVPNTTYFSSQEGPDWIITVGAVSPGQDNYYGGVNTADHASYTGAGKPADIAGIGSRYPTAYRAAFVGTTGTSGFGGTSNATPQIAGTYARALYLARRALAGPSKTQRDGVIASGPRYDCGPARPMCELYDGRLTADELRKRLFHGAVHTEGGLTPGGYGEVPHAGEDEFMSEGHGSYFGRESGDKRKWLEEFERVIGPIEGRKKTLERPAGERKWMIVDSYCRQKLWGFWRGGYYLHDITELPGSDPNYPIRSQMQESCEQI